MLTGSVLESMLHYDPDTGIFVWINPPKHNGHLRGREAGYVRPDGYKRIRINGKYYYASHLACLWMLGKLPDEEMDHIDRDPSNDQWNNLREATSSLNKFNQGRWLGTATI